MSSDLGVERTRVLLQQLSENHSQAEIGRKLMRSQGWVSQVLNGSINAIEHSVIERAVRWLGLDANFFTDPTLGPSPRYTDHLRVRPARTEHEKAVIAEWRAGPDSNDITDEDVEWAEGLSFRDLRSSGLEITPVLLSRLFRERRSQLLGRAKSPEPLKVERRPGRVSAKTK
jgi:transcriptional regulator with XRE-family HTH domain